MHDPGPFLSAGAQAAISPAFPQHSQQLCPPRHAQGAWHSHAALLAAAIERAPSFVIVPERWGLSLGSRKQHLLSDSSAESSPWIRESPHTSSRMEHPVLALWHPIPIALASPLSVLNPTSVLAPTLREQWLYCRGG